GLPGGKIDQQGDRDSLQPSRHKLLARTCRQGQGGESHCDCCQPARQTILGRLGLLIIIQSARWILASV
ncbi:MAG: hypothetical protein RL671_1518, partial [Pseudomonadota bacterium]